MGTNTSFPPSFLIVWAVFILCSLCLSDHIHVKKIQGKHPGSREHFPNTSTSGRPSKQKLHLLYIKVSLAVQFWLWWETKLLWKRIEALHKAFWHLLAQQDHNPGFVQKKTKAGISGGMEAHYIPKVALGWTLPGKEKPGRPRNSLGQNYDKQASQDDLNLGWGSTCCHGYWTMEGAHCGRTGDEEDWVGKEAFDQKSGRPELLS